MAIIRYVLIAELDETGYVLEYVDNAETGTKRLKYYWELINNTCEPLNELFQYKVNDVDHYRHDCLCGQTNGLYSVYLICSDKTINLDSSFVKD